MEEPENDEAIHVDVLLAIFSTMALVLMVIYAAIR